MDSHIRTAPLIECPSYPNSVAWSEENLLAVASGSVITILNPAQISGPRGSVKLPPSRPFSIGVVKEEDTCAPCLLSLSLSRDTHPCARSISWSPLGFACNSGCLLAVCTTEGLVKLYRAPYFEYRNEWVEVVDISKALHDYLASINYGEARKSLGILDNEHADEASAANIMADIDSPNSIQFNNVKSKRLRTPSLRKGKSFASKTEKSFPQITAEEYASRIAMLSSLVVVWSSIFSLSSESQSCNKYAILAVGGKSGKISLWKFCHPESYTIEHGGALVEAKLVGLLHAHDGWVNAISWGVLNADPLKPQLLLSTGSSDGSVRLWIIDGKQLVLSSETKFTSINLLKEVTSVTHIPISTLSIAIPTKAPDFFVLAIGKGSGSVEAFLCHPSSEKLVRLGAYHSHNLVVTGLAWGFDGCQLYSCSQDGSIYCWDLCVDLKNDLFSNDLKPNEPIEVAHLSDPCFGLVLSPGNLIIAVVRSFDADLLNPMYQARTQKAAVEFIWSCPYATNHTLERETVSSRKYSILWSFEQVLNPERPLVLWDILFALRVFKQNDPTFMESLLLDWLSSVFFTDASTGTIPFESIPTHIQIFFPRFSIRMIHILNIICRHLILPEMNIQGESEEDNLWKKLLMYSESMLRARAVTFSLQAVLFGTSKNSGTWSPVGLTQMKQWIFLNKHLEGTKDLVILSSQIDGSSDSINSTYKYSEEETCSFCSSPVPFRSPETAICSPTTGSGIGHKLMRCAVSMKLSSLSSLQWFCSSCQRWASHLLPGSFFRCINLEVDYETRREPFLCTDQLKPLCPFCGILLQRYAPSFLLSVNPV